MDVWFDCIKNVATVILLSYPLSKFPQFTRAFLLVATAKDRWMLTVIFGALSVLSMFLGAEIFNGALLDSRHVGPTVGGILAGPLVGVGAGLIGAVYRLLTGSGFTVLPDAVSLPLCGLLGGLVYEKYRQRRFSFYLPFCAGFAAEVLHNMFVLFFAQPFILAEALIGWTGWASIIVNGLGVVFFLNLLRDIQHSRYVTGARYAVKAFAVAEQTLPIIAGELDQRTAESIAAIIQQETIADAVAITVGGRLLAFHGAGADHHPVGAPSDVTPSDETAGQAYHCTNADCPLLSVITAPLTSGETYLGALQVYKKQETVYEQDVKLVASIARLLSMQFFTARASRQENLLVRSEYEALRAQIHPHFLFNALNVIKVLIREEPRRAQELLVTLAKYLRRSFNTRNDLIPFAEEMKGVEFYLEIQKARFGQRLQVVFDISPETMTVPFPPFALQPLVENALNHGFVDRGGQMNLSVSACLRDEQLMVEVLDNGSGIDDAVVEAVRNNKQIASMGVGLTNIHRRLKILYGRQYEFQLGRLEDGQGTRIALCLPQTIARGAKWDGCQTESTDCR